MSLKFIAEMAREMGTDSLCHVMKVVSENINDLDDEGIDAYNDLHDEIMTYAIKHLKEKL